MLLNASIASNLICIQRRLTAVCAANEQWSAFQRLRDWKGQNVQQLFLVNHHRSFSLRRSFFYLMNQFAADAILPNERYDTQT
jgi:hypothetical protein